jgi:membrane protein
MPSLLDFKRSLGVPMHVLQTVLDVLEQQELIVQNGDDPPTYLPARDPSLVSVTQVLNAVRIAGEERLLSPDRLPAPQPVETVFNRMQQTQETSVGDITLRDLATQDTDNLFQDATKQDW